MTKNQVSVRLSDELYKKLIALAEGKGVAKSKILVYALTDYLKNSANLDAFAEDTLETRLMKLEKRVSQLEKQQTINSNSGKAEPTRNIKLKPIETLYSLDIETLEINEKGETLRRFSRTIEYFPETFEEGVELKMIYLHGGTFEMGSSEATLRRQICEQPQHSVTSAPFFLSQCPITQAQWRKVASFPQVDRPLSPNPSYFQGDDRPVEQVSWEDAIEFCQRLSQYSQRSYRLPTEAEWEYACRAGTTTPFAYGETLRGELANYMANRTYLNEPPEHYRQETTPVQSFIPNGFGFYDMHGNVWEWCLDHWHPNYTDAPDSGIAWLSENNNSRRILRGGSWDFDPQYCRSASRYAYSPTALPLSQFGFRVVCEN